MTYDPSVCINWTLIENFNLSEKAFIAYVSILKRYQLTPYQELSPLYMLKNLFGPKAKKTKILRYGLKELVDKKVITVSYQNEGVTLYDLTPLAQYERLHFAIDDLSFFKNYEDLNSEVCHLYYLYIRIKTLTSSPKICEGGHVLKTFNNSLSSMVGCCRPVIGKRLEKLEELGFIVYEDYSDLPYPLVKEKQTLFITLPDFEDEIFQVVKRTIPAKYLKTI